MTPTDYAALAIEVVNTVAEWRGDQTSTRLPGGCRALLLGTLPQVLVDGRERAAYLGHLRAARAAPGRAAAVDAVAERVTLPTDQILRDGLAGVSDQALGVLAADPSALRSLSALIDESADAGEVGAAWWAAIHRAGRQALAERPFPPPPAELVRPAPTPIREGRTADVEPTTRTRPILKYLPWAVAAAAVLFAGVVWWTGGPRSGPAGEVAATSALSRQGVLGAGDRHSLSVQSPEEGFVTVVLVPADGRPISVLPGYGRDDIAVRPGAPATVGNLPVQSGDVVLAFVTPTPATDTIRKSVDRLQADPNRNPAADAVVRAVTSALRDARHPWVGVAPVQTVP